MDGDGSDGDREERRGGTVNDPADALTGVLRAWWERCPGVRPTQKALARRAGVDQATMSRYLNPGRPMAAPPAVVRVLHRELAAPAHQLDTALRLSRAAREARRLPRARVSSTPTAPVTPSAAPGITAAAGAFRSTEPSGPGSALHLSAAVRRGLHLLLPAIALCAGFWLRPLLDPPAVSPAVADTAATRTPAVPDTWPVVRLGDVLWEARTVQYLLKARGYPVAVTGTVDSRTVDQVVRFQTSLGLVQDGRVGRDTWPRLVVPVGGGDRGPAVTAVQSLLTGAGHPTAVTGHFTSETEDVLRIFQAEHGISVTGTAGTRDWLALVSAQGPRAHG